MDTRLLVIAVGQGKLTAAAVKTQTRTHSVPPSTGAAIAMDGGVADIAYYFPLKDVTVKEQAVKGPRHALIPQASRDLWRCASKSDFASNIDQ